MPYPRFLRGLVWSILCLGIPRGTFLAAESCDPIRTFADGKAPSREVFVAPMGNSSTGEGTRAEPYATVAQALRNARPGDAIRLLPGNYAGGIFIDNLAGTSNAPIWLGGETGQPRPVIEGGPNGLHLSRARHLVIENMEVRGAANNGINCDDRGQYANTNASRFVLFRNLFIHDIGTGKNQDGLKLSGLNDFFVLDCEFARVSSGGSGIDQVGCHRGLIARCAFTDMGNSVQCKGGSEDIEIRWNKFIDGGGRAVNIGGSTGFTFFRPPLSKTEPNFEARNIRVLANLFRGSDAPVAFVGAVDSLVAHNTIIEPARWIMRILQETTSTADYKFLPCGNNRFVNNLVVFKRAQISAPVNIGGNTEPASFQFANNLWFASDRPNQSRPRLPSSEENGLYGADPLLRDNFTLPASSPAAAKGIALTNLTADLMERCYAAPPTIGAFEANPLSE